MRLHLKLISAVLLPLLIAAEVESRDIKGEHDVRMMVERTDDLLACGQVLREAVALWPSLYDAVPRQGFGIAYDAAALRTEAEALLRDFDTAAAPFRTLLSSSDSDKADAVAGAYEAISNNYVSLIERMATSCWTFELRRARLEIDRIRAVYLATPALASFWTKEAEIRSRLAEDPVKADAEVEALLAVVRPIETEARYAALADYDALTRHLLLRRALLAGSLKSLTRNLHEVGENTYSLEAANRLRAINYLLFADRLFALPPEEVLRIFGPNQNVALLASALDVFCYQPGPQDVMQLPSFALSGVKDTFRMIDAFAAGPFKQIPPYRYRSGWDGADTLIVDGGSLTVTATGAPQ